MGGRGQGTGAAAASKRRETSEESPKGGRTASFLAFSIAASDAALALADTALAAAAAFSRRLFILHEAVARATSGGTSGRAVDVPSSPRHRAGGPMPRTHQITRQQGPEDGDRGVDVSKKSRLTGIL